MVYNLVKAKRMQTKSSPFTGIQREDGKRMGRMVSPSPEEGAIGKRSHQQEPSS